MTARVAFIGPLTVKEEGLALDLGDGRPFYAGTVARVRRDHGEALFSGDWIDALEWASAHKEDEPCSMCGATSYRIETADDGVPRTTCCGCH